MATATKMKNVLVMYHGGGYDGCISELNYAYFDGKGNFHCIFASGLLGRKTEERVLDVLAKDTTDLYEFDDPEELKRFGREAPLSHLIGVGNWLAHDPKISEKVKLTVVCEACECEVEVAGEKPEGGCQGIGSHGVGGIVSEYNGIICQQCNDKGTCACCGEYNDPEDIDFDTGYCTGAKHDEEWCLEQYHTGE